MGKTKGCAHAFYGTGTVMLLYLIGVVPARLTK